MPRGRWLRIVQQAKNGNDEERRRIIEDAFLAVLTEDCPPLFLERALIVHDYQLRQHLTDEEMREGLSCLEKKIRDCRATKELKTLCDDKCDRILLLWLLHWLSKEPVFAAFKNWLYKPGLRTVAQLFGITTKKLRKLVAKMKDTATQVEKINRRFEFGILLLNEPLTQLQNLPSHLRLYAKLLQDGAQYFGRGSAIYHNIAKARLTTYVRISTGSFHDKEVSALIAAVSDNENYDETSHRQWRKKHYERLKLVDPDLCLPKR